MRRPHALKPRGTPRSPPPAAASRSGAIPRPRARRARAAPAPVQHALLSLFLALSLVALRALRFHMTSQGVRHETLPSASAAVPLSALLHLHGAAARAAALHIFAAPKPFRGHDRVHQLRALESWLALSPRPEVTLLGDAFGCGKVAEMYGARWQRRVDTSFLGVPLFNSMLEVVNASRHEVVVLVNADILLYDDFPYAIRKVLRDFPPGWMAVGARWDLQSLPNALQVLGPGKRPPEHVRHDVVRHARTAGVLHTYGGIDLWAWDTTAGPLLHAPVPPFVYGRGKYDNWLTHEVIRANRRAVVDISEACTLVHVIHDHHLVPAAAVPLTEWSDSPALFSALSAGKQEFWSTDPRGKFELYVNSYLAAAHGSYTAQMGTILHAPLKLTSCYEHDGFCIFQRVRPHTCRCEHSAYVSEAQNDPYTVADSRVIFCGMLSTNLGSEQVDPTERWAISGRTDDDASEDVNATSITTFGLPLIQEHLLRIIASRTGSEQVFLVVADYSERSLVMELVCSMRQHGLFPWLLIAALDDEFYRYCVTRGLPVYLSEFDESEFKDHFNFRELARYQLTFEIVRKRKEVFSVEPGVVLISPLWQYFKQNVERDIDVAMLSRPLTLGNVISDARYVPSSFIYARPGDRTLDLLKNVMIGLQGHSARSGLLQRHGACGANDEGLRNASRCQLENGAVVHLFDRKRFRAIEEKDCKSCGAPVLYYSAAFGFTGDVESAMGDLKQHGLSRTDIGEQLCHLHL